MGSDGIGCVGENCSSMGSVMCIGGCVEDVAVDGRKDVGSRRRCRASAPRAPSDSSVALRVEPLGVRLWADRWGNGEGCASTEASGGRGRPIS
eukprot:1859308-Amphidinium_carterae.3